MPEVTKPPTRSRLEQIKQWLQNQLKQQCQIDRLPGDGGFRQYWRITTHTQSYILTDHADGHHELDDFIKIAKQMQANHLPIPHVLNYDLELGFLLQTDLGDRTLKLAIDPHTPSAINHYSDAIELLVELQSAHPLTNCLPLFSQDILKAESMLFVSWFCEVYYQKPLSDTEQSTWHELLNGLTALIIRQPQCPVHRDYHSRNILIDQNKLFMIDFQDAVIGPISYDIISLLRDCYIDLPSNQQQRYFQQHYERCIKHQLIPNGTTMQTYEQWCQQTSIQRLLKIIGIFARLALRDGKSQFLADIPLAIQHLSVICHHSKYSALTDMINKRIAI